MDRKERAIERFLCAPIRVWVGHIGTLLVVLTLMKGCARNVDYHTILVSVRVGLWGAIPFQQRGRLWKRF